MLDRGLLFGDGCFEVLRTWNGVAVDLGAHLDRLAGTIAALGLHTLARADLGRAVEAAITAAAHPGDVRIRIVVTRGPGALAARTAELGPGRAIVIVEPLGAPPAGLTAAIVDWPLPRRVGPGHKTLAYLDHVIARDLARAAGADEAIRLDAEGRAVEGATSNLFAVIEGTVVTTPVDAGVLPGIVRARVLTQCAALGRPVRLAPIELPQLRGASELFVTSSLRGVVPITHLDGVPCGGANVAAELAIAITSEMRALASSRHGDRGRRPG